MSQLIELAQDNIPWIGTLLIFLSVFFEFSKIKLNPLSWMFKALSAKMTEEIHQENLAIHKENEDIHKENEDINKRLDVINKFNIVAVALVDEAVELRKLGNKFLIYFGGVDYG